LQKTSKIGCIVLLSLLFASLGAVVYAQVQVSVYIMNPLNGSNGAKGVVSGNYWVGEIPITVSNSTVAAQQTKAYCMNFDKTVYAGSTYNSQATAVTDSAEWRAVSYVLTWYHPPADNDAAAANQVAIWRLLNSTRGYDYVKEPWLTEALDNAGNALANEVKDKDVVRQGDVFQWIEPVTTNQSAVMGNPGETITFKAKLTDSSGTPRPGVKILFSAVLIPSDVELNSTYVSPAVTHTDSNGIAAVNVKVPEDIQNGDRIEVKASTKSVWPQLYLDLNDERRQDLIGIGTTFEFTGSTNVCVLAYILVIPEVPLGTLTAGVACGLAFVLWKRGGHLKKPKLN
jgi:type II secretory pathway pseudopilin PulG